MNYKKLLIILMSAFLITGCSNTQKQASTENINTSQTATETPSGYYEKVFDDSGTKTVYKQNSVDFSIGQMDKKLNGATKDEMQEYAKEIDGYLSDSKPIVSIVDDEIHLYPDASYEPCNFGKLCQYLTYTPSSSLEKNLDKIFIG